MSEMRVLTVRQPWAAAILHAGKDVENRSRNIAGDYRGLVAIHAAARVPRASEVESLPRYAMSRIVRGEGREAVFGAIIGVVNLWAVHEDRDNGNCCAHRPSGGPGGSPWSQRGAWHLCVNDPRPITEPLLFTGALGLRRLNPDLIEQIKNLTPEPEVSGS